MTKCLGYLLIAVIVVLSLAACSPDAGNGSSGDSQNASGSGEETGTGLKTSFNGALSVQGQLALGSVQLEGTELAVDAKQAAELLPLWRALQSLTDSGTAAQVELDAVTRQIEGAMSVEQIQAIADMAMTVDSLTELMNSGQLEAVGFGGRAGQSADSVSAPGSPPEGFPAGGFPEGAPGGAFTGAGPGPGAGADVSEEELATRQAALEGGVSEDFQEWALTNMAIRLLAGKTGEQAANPFGNVAATVYSIAGEATGLSNEEIQAQMADGTTLAQVIEDNNGHIGAVRAALVEALSALPNAAELDVARIAEQWLGTSQP